MTLPEHELDEERDDVLEREEIPDSIDVQPEDPDYEGADSPEPVD